MEPAASVWNAIMKKIPTATRMIATISSLTLLLSFFESGAAALFPAFADDELFLVVVFLLLLLPEDLAGCFFFPFSDYL